MSDPVIDKIIENITFARIGLILHQPFFGQLATRLTIKEGGEWCTTAATDGRHVFFNKQFFEKLSIPQIEFVLCHEILHNAFDHFDRRDFRNPRLFNYASDYCVNGQIVRDKIGDWNVPDIQILHDPKYYGMSSEEIYDILKDHNDEMLDKLGELVDQHIDWSQPDPNDPSRPVYTESELREIHDGVKEAVMDAAQGAGGKVPESIKRMIKDLTEPQMNWREILQQQIQSTIKDDFSWMRPNKKSWHLSAVLPGQSLRDTIDLVVAIDTSGSMTEEMLRDLLGEVKGIMQQYQDFNIKLFCYDTEVHNVVDFDAYNIEDINEYEPMGGGGTMFECIYEYLQENDIVPKKLLNFTDMYPNSGWGIEDYCDTIFIAHGTTSIVAPFGTTIYYELSK